MKQQDSYDENRHGTVLLFPNSTRGDRYPLALSVDFLTSIRCAWQGIMYVIRTQRNMRIHLIIASIAIALSFSLHLALLEWMIVLFCIMSVLTLEIVNTAIEAVVDLSVDYYHPYAKIAKDAAAGAVLTASCGAILVGGIVFLPHIWSSFLS